MAKLFRVIGVCPTGENICLDEQNKKHFVDLLVGGTMPDWVKQSKDLVGMEVMVDYTTPYISIAINPQIVVKGRKVTCLQTKSGMERLEQCDDK